MSRNLMTAERNDPLHDLRGVLLNLPPSGAAGFEGLVASCLAALTGRTFRLAKSGLQFGRDASTQPDPFAIAMEAKRYQDAMRLEELAGKAVVFASKMGREADLWVLAVTSEVGEGVVHDLHQILAEYGVELLTLDWSTSGPPALAVLLADQREATVRWFASNAPSVDVARLEQHLVRIAGSAEFEELKHRLSEQLGAPHVGLGTLATAANAWLRERFSDPAACQRTFGQFVNVADPEHPAQPRERPVSALDEAMAGDFADRVLLLHGEEGVGKTWVVAQWWSVRTDPPILLFVSGRRVDLLDPQDPVGSIARLLGDQHPSMDRDGWRRRLLRWSTGGAVDTLRFVLVLDGINEHPRCAWADIIRAHVPLFCELGGAVVVTARTGYWEREVAPRIGGSLVVERIEVPEYSDLELASELASVGAVAANLPPHVREFVRNPRVCSVAKSLLANLVVQPEELTVERLLVEYWRTRLEERGDRARHNIVDFDNVLRAHAREWLREGRREFDRDAWATYSGAARRASPESVLQDLTEIEEGRFLTITSPAENTYAFRKEALPYALGLLVASELRAVARRVDEPEDATVDDALARILDPVRGFDRISDIVAAAIGIAGWDESTPVEVFRALLRGWCTLQNTTVEADASVLRHSAARPNAVLDVAEQPSHALPPGYQSGTLVRLLFDVRDLPGFPAALELRLPRWLGSWSIEEDVPGRGEALKRRQEEREERIRARLAALTEAERSYLRSATVEFPSPPEIGLQRLSALLLARRPIAPCASGLLAWGFAQAVAGSIHDGGRELSWVLRLNRIDPSQTTEAVRRLLAGWDPEPPPTMKRGGAYTLRLLGDDDSVRRAEELHPLQIGESWNLAQEFSDVDPCDPDAEPPTDLSRARNAVTDLRHDEIWASMGRTSEGLELEYATEPLARFEPETLIKGMRSIVATARSRSALPLRQLAFRLPALSVILEGESLRSVRERFDSLLAQPDDAPSGDLHWILSNLLAAVLPHLPPVEQIDSLHAIPSEMPPYLHLGDGLTPTSSDVLENYFSDAVRKGDEHRLLWLLFHAAYSGCEPTERIRAEVVQLFIKGSDLLPRLAAFYVSKRDDRDLNNAVVDECLRSPCPDSRYHSLALAQAVVTNSRLDAVHLVPREFIGFVADALGGDALLLFMEFVDRTLNRALSRDEPTAGDGVQLHLKASENGLELLRWGDEQRELDLMETFNSRDWAKQWEERQQRIRQAIQAFERDLASADAQYLAWAPPLQGLRALVSQVPDQFREWLTRILETSEPQRLSQVRNLGLAIASAFGYSDPALAAAGFRKLASVASVWNVRIEGVDLYTYALFSAGDGAEIDSLRRDVFEQAEDDKTVAATVLTAERHAPDWLDGHTEALMRSPTLADHALAITIEGFRVRRSGAGAPSSPVKSKGFLDRAREAADESFRRSDWCEHWLRRMREAEEPVDFWRFTVLAQGTIDFRHESAAATALSEGSWARFGSPLLRDLVKAAEKIAKEREKTLFGDRAPDPELRRALFQS